jgi:hypothetical protein
MPRTLNARLPHRVEEKLADYCARRGASRTEAVVRALDDYLDKETGGVSAYALAADLIPAKGIQEIQSGNARELARKAFRGKGAR